MMMYAVAMATTYTRRQTPVFRKIVVCPKSSVTYDVAMSTTLWLFFSAGQSDVANPIPHRSVVAPIVHCPESEVPPATVSPSGSKAGKILPFAGHNMSMVVGPVPARALSPPSEPEQPVSQY